MRTARTHYKQRLIYYVNGNGMRMGCVHAALVCPQQHHAVYNIILSYILYISLYFVRGKNPARVKRTQSSRSCPTAHCIAVGFIYLFFFYFNLSTDRNPLLQQHRSRVLIYYYTACMYAHTSLRHILLLLLLYVHHYINTTYIFQKTLEVHKDTKIIKKTYIIVHMAILWLQVL